MINILPVLLKDGYKAGHIFQYPKDTQYIYSNLTPRKSRTKMNKMVFFGLQYFLTEYLLNQFDEFFFDARIEDVLRRYKCRMDSYLGKDAIPVDHIAALHDLGYLPLHIKALPEGTLVPMGVPMLTIINTEPEFFWLTNMLETLMSNILWLPCTSATTALQYRHTFEDFAELTGGNKDFIDWQGHDFSFRGMGGLEAALLSGAAHLTSFKGTDTIPAIEFLQRYYWISETNNIIGGSVPATEHSVMCVGKPEGELETFKRLVTEVYPKGIVSIVSDTWDLWKVVSDYLPALKDIILAREGKVTIRPDSGNPVKILCGDDRASNYYAYKGLIECLADIFGTTTNEKGYKTLDSHIGAIYGDSITPDRQEQILEKLAAKGFASDNVVLGLGSYTYQYQTRDTYGMAIKATAAITASQGLVEIFKKPATDDGTKNSHKGLLQVVEKDGGLVCLQGVTPEEEKEGLLETRFLDGAITNTTSLKQIRELIKAQNV